MGQQLQLIMSVPLGRLTVGLLFIALWLILLLALAVRNHRRELAYQHRLIAHMHGEIGTEKLLDNAFEVQPRLPAQ